MRKLVWTLLLCCAFPLPTRADTLAIGPPRDSFDLNQNFVSGLSGLTDLRSLPDGRMVLIQKAGQVFVLPAGGGALVMAGSFPVDTGSEKGLLGVAVPPNFAQTGELIFYYSRSGSATPPGTNANRHRVVKRVLMANNMLAATETVLVDKLRGPANHDGGALDIGPDGMLYIGVGDTGCNSGRNPEPIIAPTNFLGTCLSDHATENGGGNGKILRINLDGSIPASNPLVGVGDVTACRASECFQPPGTGTPPTGIGPPRTEVWAWGFRNPWRIWVDPMTNRLWVGDVGEIAYEEITIARAGRHHGWPWREGGKGHPLAKCTETRVGTSGGNPVMDQDCVDPVYFCRHGGAGLDPAVDPNCTSITGGLIMDSCDWPTTFRGKYFFGDNSTQNIWTLQPNAARDGITGGRTDFMTITGSPVSIRGGVDGQLYIAVLSGRVTRVSVKPALATACPPGLDGGIIIVPPIDGSTTTPDSSLTPPIDGAADPDSGTGGGSDDGCGCRAGGRASSGALGLALLAMLLGVVVWRRRR